MARRQTLVNMTTYNAEQVGRSRSQNILIQSTETQAVGGVGVSNITRTALLPPILAPRSDDEIYVHLTSCCIPFSFYNTNTTNNQLTLTLTLTDSSGTTTKNTTFTFDPANYNAISLADVLQTKINTYFKTEFGSLNQTNNLATITFDSDNNKYTFSLNGSQFTGGVTNASVTFNFASGENQCYKALGFANTDGHVFSATVSASTNLVSDFPINLFQSNYIVIRSNFLSSNAVADSTGTTSVNSDILAMVPISTAPFTFITLSNTSIEVTNVRVRMQAIHNLEIRITDENNTQLDFNGSQWQVGLAFEVISGKTSVKKSVNRIESSDRTSDKKTRKRAR